MTVKGKEAVHTGGRSSEQSTIATTPIPHLTTPVFWKVEVLPANADRWIWLGIISSTQTRKFLYNQQTFFGFDARGRGRALERGVWKSWGSGPAYGGEIGTNYVVLKFERSQGRLSIRVNGSGPVYTIDGIPSEVDYWTTGILYNQGDKLRLLNVELDDKF